MIIVIEVKLIINVMVVLLIIVMMLIHNTQHDTSSRKQEATETNGTSSSSLHIHTLCPCTAVATTLTFVTCGQKGSRRASPLREALLLMTDLMTRYGPGTHTQPVPGLECVPAETLYWNLESKHSRHLTHCTKQLLCG